MSCSTSASSSQRQTGSDRASAERIRERILAAVPRSKPVSRENLVPFAFWRSFARFLNVTDGIVGQGLRCIFLLTANEEIGRIDAALTRPGRCLQAVEFEAFDKTEARAWLAKHGRDAGRAPESATLAELYALGDPKEQAVSAQARVGF